MVRILLDAGIGREFRVVRDNRVNQNTNRDMKPVSPQLSTSANEQVISNISEKGYVFFFVLSMFKVLVLGLGPI